ncbi:P-loop NTPase fold protein [Sphingosinicella sp.]|uniref:KAP family P-loop NTPase fold protein n=1 Tax=Sphingosinicella sp. TaxID=1917971 RepID=UPI0035AF38B1
MKIRVDLTSDFCALGFNAETDPFSKSDLAERLTKLYGNLEQGTVSILDGRWGSGKSIFVRQWNSHLESHGVPCIYFDAFAADYVDSPFRAVASAFVRAAKEARAHDMGIYNRFLTATSRATKIIAAPAAKLAVKAGTLGLIGSAEFKELSAAAEAVVSDLGDMSEAAVKAMLEEQADDEANFEALRTSLAELPSLLAKRLDGDQGATQKDKEEVSPSLVVIIDELDRCRPDFALGVLETLKHFFRAERVHFLLVTNLNHLLLSVQKRYGVGEAAGEYIQKFYDFLIPFEERPQHGRATNASLHVSRLLQTMLTGANTSDGTNLINCVAQIVIAYDLSLRQAERVATNVVLAQIDFSQNSFRPGSLVALLAVIKAQNPAMFADIKRERVNTAHLQDFINKGDWPAEFSGERLLNIVRYYSDPDIDERDPEFKGYESTHWNFRSRLDILPYLANVIDRFA